MLQIRNGKVIGCSREVHSMTYCDDCIVENCVDQEKQIDDNKEQEFSKYEKAALEIGKLVALKQIQYGDSFTFSSEILKILYPNGISSLQMNDMLTVTRIIDKLFRIANGDQGDESAWNDICGYSLLAITKRR